MKSAVQYVSYGIAALALAAAPLAAQQSTTPQPDTRQGSTPAPTTRQPSDANKSDASKASVPAADQHFAMDVARANMAEVEVGKLAGEKASSDTVKKYAEKLVDDHTRAGAELKTLAQSKGITLPSEVDAKHKSVHDRLAKLSGAEFDRAFMTQMTSAHRDAVSLFRKESQSGKDADLKAFAAKTLPTLEEHLKEAQAFKPAPVGTSGTKSNSPRTDSPSSPSNPSAPRNPSSPENPTAPRDPSSPR